MRAFACGGRVVKRLGDALRRGGRQLVILPHSVENLPLLGFQLSHAVFEPRRLALQTEYLLVCVLRVAPRLVLPRLKLLALFAGLRQFFLRAVRQRVCLFACGLRVMQLAV